MAACVPEELTGLWSRELITAPGLRDDTTRVLWLQTRSWYVDIRVPADRPNAVGRTSFAEFTEPELLRLAHVEGFGGELSVADGICAWRRDLDYQPPPATPDEGRYTLHDEVMIEDGVHLDYQETWRRQSESTSPLLALRLENDPAGREGLLVVGGRHLLEFVAQPRSPRPKGVSLADLVKAELAAGRRRRAEALLDTRIRYAALEAGGWQVKLSSLPWCEGEPIWSGGVHLDSASGVLEVIREGQAERWRLLDATPGADLTQLTSPRG